MVRVMEHHIELKAREVIDLGESLLIIERKQRGRMNPVNDVVGMIEIMLHGAATKVLSTRLGAFIVVDKYYGRIECMGKIFVDARGYILAGVEGIPECIRKVIEYLKPHTVVLQNKALTPYIGCVKVEKRYGKKAITHVCYLDTSP